jgi:hypothetical protein
MMTSMIVGIRSRLCRKTLILVASFEDQHNDGTTSGGSVDPGALNANEKIDFLDISQ